MAKENIATRFDASRVAYGDFRTFDKKNPPHEQPSLAIALRIDESGVHGTGGTDHRCTNKLHSQ